MSFQLPVNPIPTAKFRKKSNAHRPFLQTLWNHSSKRVVAMGERTTAEGIVLKSEIRIEHWGTKEECRKCPREGLNMGDFENQLSLKGLWVLVCGPLAVLFLGPVVCFLIAGAIF